VIFLTLALVTPSWRVGPFSWWPVWRLPMLAGRPADLGLLSLLPALVVVTWIALRLGERPGRPWLWGGPSLVLPLLGLTLLGLVSLEWALTWRTTVQVVGFGLFWLVYLYVVNESPSLTLPLAIVVLVQGGVAIGQFLRQGDLGLRALGELALDPAVRGTSVFAAGGRPWLRAYGLTAHPNVLGAMLAVLLLLLLADLSRLQRWQRVGLLFVLSVGLMGLLTSFSRNSWLAFAIGLMAWGRGRTVPARLRKVALLLLPIAILFLWRYRELLLSRFLNLGTVLEARSLNERWRDMRLAVELIVSHPWRGVGSGVELTAAQRLDPQAATVHNVPLLVSAELGLPGAALYLWLAVAGLCSGRAALAPWLAMLVIGLFDNTLWLTASWRAAILMALLTARVAQSAARPLRARLPIPRPPGGHADGQRHV
jgi:O-antigen ligase